MSLRTAAITGEDADAVVEIGTQARAEEARVLLSQSQFCWLPTAPKRSRNVRDALPVRATLRLCETPCFANMRADAERLGGRLVVEPRGPDGGASIACVMPLGRTGQEG